MKYRDREFRPDRQMTRAEFAAVLSRSQALVTEDAKEGAWYAPHVAALKAHEIIPAGAYIDDRTRGHLRIPLERWGEHVKQLIEFWPPSLLM